MILVYSFGGQVDIIGEVDQNGEIEKPAMIQIGQKGQGGLAPLPHVHYFSADNKIKLENGQWWSYRPTPELEKAYIEFRSGLTLATNKILTESGSPIVK